jgi:hypothetical protein
LAPACLLAPANSQFAFALPLAAASHSECSLQALDCAADALRGVVGGGTVTEQFMRGSIV